MSQSHSRITPFSLLALAMGVIGGAGTIGIGHLWLINWANSGQKFTIAQWHEVELGPSDLNSLVYYESDDSVGLYMRLDMHNAYDERSHLKTPDNDNSFAVGTRQGRSLFRLTLEEPGVYKFRCGNSSYSSDDQIPPGDRLVFSKSPQTWEEVMGIRKNILVVGGTLTIAATLACYVGHGITLARRKRSARGTQ